MPKPIEPVVVRAAHLRAFQKVQETRKTEYRQRSPFKLAGIALAARMEAFAGITGSGAG
jgi:hypothetical protein